MKYFVYALLLLGSISLQAEMSMKPVADAGSELCLCVRVEANASHSWPNAGVVREILKGL